MAYAIGHISGCHLNPAVSVGLCAGRRFPARDLPAYVAAQVVGGVAGAGVLYVIASGKAGFTLAGGFASNGYGDHSPGGYSLTACLVAEVVLTFMFLLIIMGSTDRRAPQGFAPLAIGLGLTLIHLIGIPVTNLSVNPARSTGPALFVGGWALAQLWLFWVAPLVGGALGGIVYGAPRRPTWSNPPSARWKNSASKPRPRRSGRKSSSVKVPSVRRRRDARVQHPQVDRQEPPTAAVQLHPLRRPPALRRRNPRPVSPSTPTSANTCSDNSSSTIRPAVGRLIPAAPLVPPAGGH